MAYNFETTFVQPLLNDLDNGLIAGADDWANAITKYYINTIKLGLPQNVPVTLPAPGLNPTAPPPFVIGASPFLSANSRRQTFYDTIHAYFLAKDISLNEGAIKSLASTVKQLSAKVKTRRSQIKTLTQEIKLITKELAQLPQTIKDIKVGIKEAIKLEIQQIDKLFSSLEDFKLSMSQQEYEQLFAKELSIINLIKDFDIENVQGLLELRNYIKNFRQKAGNQTVQGQVKKYVSDRLIEIATRILQYSEIITNPTEFVNFVNNLAKVNSKLNNFAAAVRRLAFVERYLKPKLKKLKIQKDAKIKEIKEMIQPKIDDVKKRLEDRISELKNKKAESKRKGLYESASRRVKDLKQRHADKIKKTKKVIKRLKSITKKSTAIATKIVTLKRGIEQEFESLKQQLSEIKSTVKATQQDIDNVQSYMHQEDLAEYANIAVTLVVDTQCSFTSFINQFELKYETYIQYFKEIKLLRDDVEALIEEVQALGEDLETPRSTIRKQYDPGNSKGKSLKQLLHELLVYLIPASEKLVIYLDKQKQKLERFIEKTSQKFESDLETFLINIVPLRSDIQDSRDKQAELEAKKKRIEEKKKQVKKIKEYSSAVILVSKNAPQLISNLSSGKFKPSENDSYIRGIAEGIYTFRAVDQPNDIKLQLKKQKDNFIGEFKTLVVIEHLISSIVLVFDELNKGGASKDVDQLVSDLRTDSTQSGSQVKSFFTTLSDLIKNPPKSPQQVKAIVETISLEALEDIAIVNRLLAIENKHLTKARQSVKTLADIKRLDKYPKAQSTLNRWNKAINKQDSFLKFLFKELHKLIKQFLQFVKKQVKSFLEPAKDFIEKKTARFKEDYERKLKTTKDKNVNTEAPLMSVVFGLAARLFWTGAQWIGPTGSVHTSLNVGVFTRIKAKPTEGASEMVRQMARGFENQVKVMSGIVSPPPVTGIPPVPFNGYI